MICADCRNAADLARGTLVIPGRAKAKMRASFAAGHERCRERGDGCTCQHGDHGNYTPGEST